MFDGNNFLITTLLHFKLLFSIKFHYNINFRTKTDIKIKETELKKDKTFSRLSQFRFDCILTVILESQVLHKLNESACDIIFNNVGTVF